MSSASIGGVSSGSSSTVQPKSMQEMTSNDFLKIMLTQLTTQDPFEPVKNQDLLNQVSSIRSLEMNQTLNTSLSNLALQGSMGSAGSLIGKAVTGLGDDKKAVTGLVTGVRVTDDRVMLELDNGKTLGMDSVTHISNLPPSSATAH